MTTSAARAEVPRSARRTTPWRCAIRATASAPTLWRVCAYSLPGLPSPTARRSAVAPVLAARRADRGASSSAPGGFVGRGFGSGLSRGGGALFLDGLLDDLDAGGVPDDDR